MATTAYQLVITASSPLCFSQRRPGGIFQESLPYIPGSALRGTVAGMVLRQGRHPHIKEEHHSFQEDCDFCQQFLGRQAAIFTNAYPAAPEHTPYLLPGTAASCKNHQGFRSDDSNLHGVFDTLIDRLCWETLQPPGLVYAPDCPSCRGRADKFQAVFSRDRQNAYHRHKVQQRLLTRVAINRRRAVAEEGLLYSPWVIEEVDRNEQPARFVARLYRAGQALADLVSSVTAVGGKVSRGLNHVQVEVEPLQVENAAAIQSRVERFNERVEATWQLYQALGGGQQAKTGLYFTIGLQAPAILRTADGRATMRLEPGLLSQADNRLKANSLKLVHSYAGYYYAGGWNSAWKLPKPAQVCTEPGSVYLFHAPDGLATEQYQALAELQTIGLGERTNEGYGQVRVCDEFHLIRRDGPV